jgi:RimJ/RimL family protein N-acetyltransferase/peptidase E
MHLVARLLLASRGIPGLAALLGARGPRTLLIPTASPDPAIADEVERELTAAGLDVTRRADPAPEGFDVVAVSGGNPYTLLAAMRGFTLPPGVVYVGYSAGAIVAGPTLAPLRLTSPFTPPDDLDLTGLGLCDVVVLPHDNRPGRAERNAAAVAAFGALVQPLADGELVLVDGDRVRVLGRPLIRGARVVLREPDERDIPQIVEGCNDPEVPRFIPLVPAPYTERDAREWLASTDERSFAITEDGGEMLGAIGLRGASLGYWLRPGARGRGLASDAVRAVVEWARRDDLHLTVHPDNLASQLVAERAGFVRAGWEGDELRFERRR